MRGVNGVVAALLFSAAGCGGGPGTPASPAPAGEPAAEVVVVEGVPADPPLPRVQVEQVAGGPGMERGPPGVPVEDEVPQRAPRVAGSGSARSASSGPATVTLTAVGTEIRSLLVVLAEAAGVDLVVDPSVGGRVTVHFQDVPAREALEQVIRETGHMIVRPLTAPFPPTVYYVAPVNVNEVDAATIRARFDVSGELARFIIRSRIPPR